MADFIQSGRVADVVIALMLLEAAALHILYRTSGRGLSLSQLSGNFFAGICLVLALRAALTASAWWWPAFWLAASFAGHIADLRGRWRET